MLYRCEIKAISRKGGKSIAAKIAYRSAQTLTDSAGIRRFPHRKHQDVSMAKLIGWDGDRQSLCDAIEASEKRKASRLAREAIVALPSELDQEQRNALALKIGRAIHNKHRVAVDVCVHIPKDGDNHHAHILFTTRRVKDRNQLTDKTREFDDLKAGPDSIDWIRWQVEKATNEAYEAAGIDLRVSRKSNVARGIKTPPTPKVSPAEYNAAMRSENLGKTDKRKLIIEGIIENGRIRKQGNRGTTKDNRGTTRDNPVAKKQHQAPRSGQKTAEIRTEQTERHELINHIRKRRGLEPLEVLNGRCNTRSQRRNQAAREPTLSKIRDIPAANSRAMVSIRSVPESKGRRRGRGRLAKGKVATGNPQAIGDIDRRQLRQNRLRSRRNEIPDAQWVRCFLKSVYRGIRTSPRVSGRPTVQPVGLEPKPKPKSRSFTPRPTPNEERGIGR